MNNGVTFRHAQDLASTDQTPASICLIARNDDMSRAIRKTLDAQDYHIDTFANATQADEALGAYAYDVLVIDVDLAQSKFDVEAFIQAIRHAERPSLRLLPILVLVDDADPRALQRLFRAGANDCIPLRPRSHELTARIANLVHLQRTISILSDSAEPHRPKHRPDTLVQLPDSSVALDAPQPTPSDAPNRISSQPAASAGGVGRVVAQKNKWDAVLATTLIKHPWMCLWVVLLLLTASSFGLKDLSLTTDYRVFFSDTNPELLAFDQMERTYAKNFGVVFVVSPKSGNVFTRETLAIIEQITELGWQVPFAARVDSITNFQHTWSQDDELVVANLVTDPANLTQTQLDWIRETALHEPLLRNRLISKSGEVTGVNVAVQMPGKEPYESLKIAEYSLKLKRQLEQQYPEVEIRLIGQAIQDHAFFEATMQDVKSLIPAMYLFIIVMVAVILRSVAAMLAVTVMIAAASVTAMGTAGWLGIQLSATSSIAPTIILTLAVANSIHVLTIFFNLMQQGMAKQAALTESMRLNLHPIFLTSATTAIGFLSMNFSDSPPFHDLGNIVAMGVVASFIYTITILPAIMSLLPTPVKPAGDANHNVMYRLANFVVQYRNRLALLVGIILPILTAGILLIDVDDNFIEYFDERYEFRRDATYVQDNLTGLTNVEFSIGSGQPGGINDPFYLQKLDEFAYWLRDQKIVVHVNTITDIVKRLNFNMHNNDPAYYRLPEQRALTAQYIFLYELSLPQGLDINNQINLDKSASRVTVTLRSISNRELLDLELLASAWLRNNAPEYMHTRGASPTLMFANIGQRNIRAMFSGTILALLLISAVLIISLRSWKIGIISLLPNFIPAIMAFGIWGLLVGKVGLAISVVSAMALGIIVDDTVHFLSKYLSARRERALSSIEAVKATFVQVGPALVTTSILLVGGFLLLALSGFSVNANMGMLVALTIAIALVADILFLPPLLIWIDRQKPRKDT